MCWSPDYIYSSWRRQRQTRSELRYACHNRLRRKKPYVHHLKAGGGFHNAFLRRRTSRNSSQLTKLTPASLRLANPKMIGQLLHPQTKNFKISAQALGPDMNVLGKRLLHPHHLHNRHTFVQVRAEMARLADDFRFIQGGYSMVMEECSACMCLPRCSGCMAAQIPPKRCFDLQVPVHPDGRLVQRCRRREAEPRTSHLWISNQADVATSSFKFEPQITW